MLRSARNFQKPIIVECRGCRPGGSTAFYIEGTMKRRAFDAWKKRLEGINSFTPFGPHQEIRDLEGRLHCETGPAVITPVRCTWYNEGRKNGTDVDIYGSIHYYFENIMIPGSWWKNRDNLTFKQVMEHRNAEVRYVGMRMYGYERMIEEGQMVIVDETEDKEYTLMRCPQVFNDELLVLKVTDATPQPDGTRKVYFLHVPPNMKRCKEAVAWTFRMNEKEYQPSQEA